MFTTLIAGHVIGPILALAVTALVPVIAASLFQWLRKLGLDIEQNHREALQSALHNAGILAVEKLTGVKGKQLTSPASVIPDVNAAVTYVENSVPDALAKFKIGPAKLRELLQPHIARALEGKE